MPRLAVILLLAYVLFAGALHADQGDQLLRVHFIDVGQGDAIWIQGPAGEGSETGLNMIIDGGPDTDGGNRLIPYLDTLGLKPNAIIDYVIVTHPHDDHYPGLKDLFATYQVKTIIDSGFPKEGTKFKAFLDIVRNETVNGRKSQFVEMRNQPDFVLPSSGELEMRILYADSASATGLGSQNTRENNASTVIRIAFRSFSFLFMGDAEGKERGQPADTPHFVEQVLLSKLTPEELRATVLKAGHHGSETGSTLPFIRAVQPDIVVISSGRKAFSGTFLPDASVIARYRSERPGVTIVRTDERDAQQGLDTTDDADGDDIMIFTDGDSLQVHQARGPTNRRRWVKLRTIQQ